MNLYRISFIHMDNLYFRTLMEASNEEEAYQIVLDKIENKTPFMTENNRAFFANINIIPFIEIELMRKDSSKARFDDMINCLNSLSNQNLETVFNGLKQNYLATAFKNNIHILKDNYSSYFKDNILRNIEKESNSTHPPEEDYVTAINFIINFSQRVLKK